MSFCLRFRLLGSLVFGLLVPCVGIAPLGVRAQEVESAAAPAEASEAPATLPLDPLVQEVLDLKPERPAELMQAVVTLLNLKAPASAKPLVEKLLAANPEASVAADLVRRFGMDEILRIGRTAELAPLGAELANRLVGQISARAQDPARVAELAAQVAAGTPAERTLAMAGLRQAGPVGVSELLLRLRGATRADEAAALRQALAQLGPAAVLPAARVELATAGPGLALQLLTLLGELDDLSARADLWPWALAGSETARTAARQSLYRLGASLPSADDAARRLANLAEQAWSGTDLVAGPAGSPVSHWQRGAASERVEPVAVSPELAKADRAARLARDGYTLWLAHQTGQPLEAVRSQPIDPAAAADGVGQRLADLAILSQIEASALARSEPSDTPTPIETSLLAVAGTQTASLERLLGKALDQQRSLLGQRLARLLGQQGQLVAMDDGTGRPTPLLRALHDAHPGVRWKALEAALAILGDSDQPLAGSSWIVDELTHFAGAQGERRAWVADRDWQQSTTVAGWLTTLDYTAESLATGRALIQYATHGADTELIVMSITLECPAAAETLETLRGHYRTARVPVVLVAGIDQERQAQRLAARFPYTTVLLRPHDEAGMRILASRGAALLPSDWPPAAERLTRAGVAWEALVARGARPGGLADPSQALAAAPQTVLVDSLRPLALAALAELPTRAAQLRLVDLASESQRPISQRQQALSALGGSLDRFGVLLSPEQLLRQYERYNASETADSQTQRVLSTILDLFEARASAVAANADL